LHPAFYSDFSIILARKKPGNEVCKNSKNNAISFWSLYAKRVQYVSWRWLLWRIIKMTE